MGTVGTKILKYKEGELYYQDGSYYWYYKGNKTCCTCEKKSYIPGIHNGDMKDVLVIHDGDQFLLNWAGFDNVYTLLLYISYKDDKMISRREGSSFLPTTLYRQYYKFKFIPSDVSVYTLHFPISSLSIPVIEIPINFLDTFADRVNRFRGFIDSDESEY